MEEQQQGKICTRCETFRPLEMFYKTSKTKSGRLGHCKLCRDKNARIVNVFGVNNRIKYHIFGELKVKEATDEYIIFKNNEKFNKLLMKTISDIKSQTTFQFKSTSSDYNEQEIKCYKTSFYSSVDENYKEHLDQNQLIIEDNKVFAALLVSYCSTKKKIMLNLLAIKEI